VGAPTNLPFGITGSHQIASLYSPTMSYGTFASTNIEKSGQVGNYCMTTRKSNPHSFSSLSIYSWSTAISNIVAWRNHRPFVFFVSHDTRYYSISSLAPPVRSGSSDTPVYGSTFPVLAPVIYYHSSFPCFMPRHKCSRVYGRGCRRCKVLERDRCNPSSRSSLRSSRHPPLLPVAPLSPVVIRVVRRPRHVAPPDPPIVSRYT
jgi:hypothetical protein